MSIETVQAPAPAVEEAAPVVTTEEKIQRAIAAADAKEGTTPEAQPEASKPGEPAGDAPSEQQPGGDARKAMQLLKSGDEVAAIKELLGDEGVKALKLDSKSWKAFRHQRDQSKARSEQSEQAANARLSEAQQLAREVYNEAAPLIEARKVFQTGDAVGAMLKIAESFGVDVNDLQRMMLRQRQGQDPQVAKLEKKFEDYAKSVEDEKAQARQAQQEQAQREQVERYAQHVRETISQVPGAPPEAAKNKYFLHDVMAELDSSYDHRTRTTVPISEAIESVLSRDEWAAMRTGERRISGNTVQADNPAQPSRRMARSLNQRNAASAAASGPPLRGAALIAHYRRLHDSGALG